MVVGLGTRGMRASPQALSRMSAMGATVLASQTAPVTADDRERFQALAEEHLDSLFRAALRLTRNRTRAEDLLQETFLRAWRSYQTFKPGTNARAWLYKILMNAYIDGYRKATREPEIVDHEDVDEFYLYTKVQESDDFRRVVYFKQKTAYEITR